jgi:cytochrome oxidase Cu insertion factor (SCO1/SenC/PrrC family)
LSARLRLLLWTLPLVALLVAAGAYLGRRPDEGADAADPPLRDPVPVGDFALVERSGRTVRRSDLLGKVWIADFVFTRCPGPCPILTREMKRLANDLPPDVRFVSITVDPEYDTPEVLTTYADSCGAEAGRWLFLTGEKEAVYDLIRKGFSDFVEPEPGGVAHSKRFFLVDRAGGIRGSYMGDDVGQVERLKRDVRRLLREPPG